MFTITFCPTCGSDKVKKVRRSVTRQFRGQAYVVPNVEFVECRQCGEKIYDREAMRKIQEHSPAFAKAHAAR